MVGDWADHLDAYLVALTADYSAAYSAATMTVMMAVYSVGNLDAYRVDE